MHFHVNWSLIAHAVPSFGYLIIYKQKPRRVLPALVYQRHDRIGHGVTLDLGPSTSHKQAITHGVGRPGLDSRTHVTSIPRKPPIVGRQSTQSFA